MKKIISLFLILSIFFNILSFTALADAKPLVINKYTFTTWTSGSADNKIPTKNVVKSISKGVKTNLFLTIVDPNNTAQIDKSSGFGTIIKSGSFYVDDSLSKPETEIIEIDSGNFVAGKTTFTVRISGIVYSGKGNAIDMVLYYKDINNNSYEYDLTSTFIECQEYVAPSTPDTPAPLEPVTPNMVVDSYTYHGEVVPGNTVKLKAKIKNTSDRYDIENIVIKVTAPDGFVLTNTSNIHISRMADGGYIEQDINFIVKNSVKAGYGTFNFDFSFQYVANNSRRSGSSTDSIPVQIVKSGEKETVPNIRIENYSLGGKILPGANVPLNLKISNKSNKYDAENINMKVTLPDGFSMEGSNSIYFDKIPYGKTVDRAIYLIVSTNVRGGYKSLGFDFSYQYDANDTTNTGNSSENISVPVTQANSLTNPYVMVTATKPKEILAGNTFALKLNIANIHETMGVEGVVIKLTLPEDLVLTDSSNTIYIKDINAGKSLSKTVNIKVKSTAKPQINTISADSSYSYITGDSSNNGQTSTTIPIPILQEDRLSTSKFELADMLFVGEEQIGTISLLNKGRSDIFNITGSITGNLENGGQEQYKGNLEAGKEISIDFKLIANAPGPVKGDILIKYEDVNMNPKEIKIPYTLECQQRPPMEPPQEFPIEQGPSQDDKAKNKKKTIVIASVSSTVVIIALTTGIIIIKKRRKSRSEFVDEEL